MATKVNFFDWGKPTQIKAFFIGDEESSLGQIVFFCDGLKQVIVQPVFQGTYSCRVSLERSGCEGIHLVLLDFHVRWPEGKT